MKRTVLAAVVALAAALAVFLLGSGEVVEAQCRLLSTSGRVQWIRVNQVGTGFGPSDDFIDGEVIFQLTGGDDRYGFKLRNNENALVAQGGLSLLQDAMRSGWSVEVDFDDCGGRNHEVGFWRIRVIA
jgi:hypothetical protein